MEENTTAIHLIHPGSRTAVREGMLCRWREAHALVSHLVTGLLYALLFSWQKSLLRKRYGSQQIPGLTSSRFSAYPSPLSPHALRNFEVICLTKQIAHTWAFRCESTEQDRRLNLKFKQQEVAISLNGIWMSDVTQNFFLLCNSWCAPCCLFKIIATMAYYFYV